MNPSLIKTVRHHRDRVSAVPNEDVEIMKNELQFSSEIAQTAAVYDRVVIYYFSGTGNARRAAEWISAAATEKKISSQVIDIARLPQKRFEPTSAKTLIGFCYPTHGFITPPIMLRFIRRFPAPGKADVFLLNTRAGLKLGRIYIPGLSGLAQILPALILMFKRYRVTGYRPLDLPSNWISLHPALRGKAVRDIFRRCKGITGKFADRILQGRPVYRGWFDLPLDILIAPVSVLYYFYGRFGLAKTYIATNRCDGCNVCAEQCPVKAIQMRNGRPYWTFHCESCMHCMNFCPQQAIQTPHGFIAMVWWLVFSVIPMFLLQQWQDFLAGPVPGGSKLWYYLFMFSTGLLFVFISYKILYLLMQRNIFNRLVALTSLTFYRFWGRYRAIRDV